MDVHVANVKKVIIYKYMLLKMGSGLSIIMNVNHVLKVIIIWKVSEQMLGAILYMVLMDVLME